MDEDLQPTTPSPSEPRKGSARERRDRRRQRQQHVSRPGSTRGSSRPQLVPAGGFKLPSITIPNPRLVLSAAGAVLAIVVVIFILGRLKNNTPQPSPNAIWLGTEWTYQKRTNDDLVALSQRLHANHIGTVYSLVAFLRPDGAWGGDKENTSFSQVQDNVKNFVKQFRVVYPDVRLYGWVSIPTVGLPPRLGDAKTQQSITDFSQQLVSQFGFDGVLLNVDLVGDKDQDFLGMLRGVRAALSTDKLIAVSVPPDWTPADTDIPLPPRIAAGTVWSTQYKQDVALLADEIVVMAFNSGFTSDSDYSQWLAYQVKTFADAVSGLQNPGDQNTARLVIVIPTTDAQLPAHDPNVENIGSALSGIRLGLQQAGTKAQFVKGLALYAEWSTDDTEWQQFQTGWGEKQG